MKRLFILAFIALCLPWTASAAIKVQDIKTLNGLHVWLVEDHSLPIVTLRLAYAHSGAADDPKGKEGLSYFYTLLFNEGAGDLDSLAYNRAIDDHAIRLGVDTDEDMLNVSMQTLSENKAEAIRLLQLALAQPRFDADAIERMRQSAESQLRELNESPSYLASLHWKELAFKNTAYGRPKYGTPESVQSFTREDMQHFVQEHIQGRTPLVAVVGDITPDEVRAWPFSVASAPEVQTAEPDIAMPDGHEPDIVRMKVPQTVVEASVPGVKRSDPDYYAAAVLDQILGGNSLTSVLGQEIRDKRGLAYYANSALEMTDRSAYMLMNFATRNEQAFAALRIFTDTLKTVAQSGVSAAQVDGAKRYLTGSFPLELGNQGTLSAFLISMQHYNLGIDYLDRRNAFIAAVTPEQVSRVAKKLLSHPPLVVMVGDPSQEQKP